MPTDPEEEVNARAEALVRDMILLIEKESRGPDDVLRSGVGVLLGRAAKIEAVLEQMTEILKEQAKTVLFLTLQVRQQDELIRGLLNEELRAKRGVHQH